MKENPSTGSFQNEPLTDFSRAESREAMRQAIAMVQKQVGGSYPPVVGGKSLATTSWIDSVNPSHKDAIVGRCGRSTPAQAEEAVRVAMHAFPSWR
ncbi:MAG: L-glutamate gamma-semialdehyde dehydrogenase, partial [Gemmataceae bacterium]